MKIMRILEELSNNEQMENMKVVIILSQKDEMTNEEDLNKNKMIPLMM